MSGKSAGSEEPGRLRQPADNVGPRVGIIVLHWNKPIETSRCLRSLSGLDYPNAQIYLVDNGSDEPYQLEIQDSISNVVVLRSKTNRGFAGGCNFGINAAVEGGCDFVWLLNNDTLVEPDALDKLVAAALSEATVGIVGSKIFDMKDREKVIHIGGHVYPHLGVCRHINVATDDLGKRIFFVTGCSMLARAAMIEQVGLLDEKYFLYWEDADWCVRAERHGWQVVMAEESKVYHDASSSLGAGSPWKEYFLARNSVRFVCKLYPWLLPTALYWWPRQHLVNHVFRKRFRHVSYALRGLLDVVTGRVLVPTSATVTRATDRSR